MIIYNNKMYWNDNLFPNYLIEIDSIEPILSLILKTFLSIMQLIETCR